MRRVREADSNSNKEEASKPADVHETADKIADLIFASTKPPADSKKREKSSSK